MASNASVWSAAQHRVQPTALSGRFSIRCRAHSYLLPNVALGRSAADADRWAAGNNAFPRLSASGQGTIGGRVRIRMHMHHDVAATYLALVQQYYAHLQGLYSVLEPQIQLRPVESFGDTFVPTEATITQQLTRWPSGLFRYPPATWVVPRKGEVRYQQAAWLYAFHGTGLSFIRTDVETDVSGEFAGNGTLALTAHTVLCYLSSTVVGVPYAAELLSLHEHWFKTLVDAEVLQPIPPFYDGDELTFMLAA
jgi:hypothetical protein